MIVVDIVERFQLSLMLFVIALRNWWGLEIWEDRFDSILMEAIVARSGRIVKLYKKLSRHNSAPKSVTYQVY